MLPYQCALNVVGALTKEMLRQYGAGLINFITSPTSTFILDREYFSDIKFNLIGERGLMYWTLCYLILEQPFGVSNSMNGS